MLPCCDTVVSAWTDLARLLCSEGVTPHTCGNSLRLGARGGEWDMKKMFVAFETTLPLL